MILSTTMVTVLGAAAVIFCAFSGFESARPFFKTLGMPDLVSAPVSKRILVGNLSSIFGGMIAAVWIWAIQRQEVVGQTSLCVSGSGCANALSDHTLNAIPFTNLQYGLFFVIWFCVLSFFALSIHLDHNWSKNGGFLNWGRNLSLIGSVIAIIMLVTHLGMVEESPAICPLCLIVVVANLLTLFQFHQLQNLHSDGAWTSKS
ncbi:MAG: hypothetical protein CMA77_00175 [Euryarchaeota archaeon]|nr:hypothetical protein [Euryarchaeota archaeon]